jgi:hypothetical protein
MKNSWARIFLVSWLALAGCATSLDPNFYQPGKSYPDKIPLTVGVKVGSLPREKSISNSGKERIEAEILKTMANVFEKADFVSNLSTYDILSYVTFTDQGGFTPGGAETLEIVFKNPKDGRIVDLYRSKAKISWGFEYALKKLPTFLFCYGLCYSLDPTDGDFEETLSRNFDRMTSKIYHDRHQLLTSLNASDNNAQLLAQLQALKNRLRELQNEGTPQSQNSPSSMQNDQSQILTEIKSLQSQISSLKPKAKASIHSDVDSPSFEDPKNSRDFALVIGVENYSQGIPRADFADRDAHAIFRHLVALGVPPRHIQRLTDATATRGRILASLHWLYRNVKPGGTVYVYYSGHGSPGQNGNAYLVPSDGDPSNLKETAISVQSLYQSLNRLPARHVIVAMDACFTGQGKRSVLGQGARPLVTKIREGAFPASGKLIAFSAAKADQESGVLDSQGHGLFTYYFLKGLDKGAVKDGHVTVEALYRYLEPKVADEASIDNRNQTPELEPRALGQDSAVRLR